MENIDLLFPQLSHFPGGSYGVNISLPDVSIMVKERGHIVPKRSVVQGFTGGMEICSKATENRPRGGLNKS